MSDFTIPGSSGLRPGGESVRASGMAVLGCWADLAFGLLCAMPMLQADPFVHLATPTSRRCASRATSPGGLQLMNLSSHADVCQLKELRLFSHNTVMRQQAVQLIGFSRHFATLVSGTGVSPSKAFLTKRDLWTNLQLPASSTYKKPALTSLYGVPCAVDLA